MHQSCMLAPPQWVSHGPLRLVPITAARTAALADTEGSFMRRLLMVMVAVLSLASFTTVALAQDSTATSPSSGSSSMEGSKKPAKSKKMRKHHKRSAKKSSAAKHDSTSTH